MSEKLEPCPFCGSPAEEYPDGDMEGYSIHCSSAIGTCPTNTFGHKDRAASIEQWNRRELESASQPGGGEARYAGELAKAIGLPVGSCNGRRVGFAWDYLIGMVEDMVSYYEREEKRAAPSAGNGGAEES